MLKIRIVTILIIIGAIGLALASYLLPVPNLSHITDSIRTTSAFQSTLSTVIFDVALNIGAVWLFLLGLTGFTPAFRRSYYWFCAGLAVQAIGALTYIALMYLGMLQTDIGIIINEVPLATGIVIIFYGLVKFARLLQAPTWLVRLRIVAVVYGGLMVVVWLLPHKPDVAGSSELVFRVAHGLQFTEALFYVLCAGLAWRIRSVASLVYSRPMNWFAWAVLTALLASGLLFSADYLYYPAWLTLDIMAIPFILTNLLSVVAGYSFNKINHLPPGRAKTSQNSLVDSIVLLASLVSKPSEADPILNDLRAITAKHQHGESYAETEAARLRQVYRRLEDYLVNQERLRSLNRQQLDDLVQERLGAVVK